MKTQLSAYEVDDLDFDEVVTLGGAGNPDQPRDEQAVRTEDVLIVSDGMSDEDEEAQV